MLLIHCHTVTHACSYCQRLACLGRVAPWAGSNMEPTELQPLWRPTSSAAAALPLSPLLLKTHSGEKPLLQSHCRHFIPLQTMFNSCCCCSACSTGACRKVARKPIHLFYSPPPCFPLTSNSSFISYH